MQGVAKMTGGTTEFLADEERLQPKVRNAATLPPIGRHMNCKTILRDRKYRFSSSHLLSCIPKAHFLNYPSYYFTLIVLYADLTCDSVAHAGNAM